MHLDTRLFPDFLFVLAASPFRTMMLRGSLISSCGEALRFPFHPTEAFVSPKSTVVYRHYAARGCRTKNFF